MIEHQERWQVFAPNGERIPGESILPIESRRTDKIVVGAVHIWIWRRTPDGIAVLLQRRAKEKPTWPDYLDISVAGHIDADESALQAAMREGKEEVGIIFDVDALEYIFGYRNFKNGIKWVYLYEEVEPQTYSFNDGEVQSLDWVNLSHFEEMISNPETYKLTPHPTEYFSLLVKALQHIHENH